MYVNVPPAVITKLQDEPDNTAFKCIRLNVTGAYFIDLTGPE